MEKLACVRLTSWMENHKAFPPCMTGIRQRLSAQESILDLKQVAAATHFVRWVAKKTEVVKKHNVMKLINAYVLSHIAYVTAYAGGSRGENEKLNAAVRKNFKTAMHVPQYTKTYRLHKLGMQNTLDEITEAQRTAQLKGLSGTRKATHILDLLGIKYHVAQGLKEALLPEVRDAILTEKIHRNRHPVHDLE
ncbi:hypothetical protein HPB51_027600 [Rhipicephalus microplus]|uniref:Tick transposon n=1 Tax=Rhipicephalus microplus TaxID=6941 RepID=A0A9J6CZY3_RHIMP|nr:hypothetical protein HPB51_027600 [Rhipicephalus microplus]